MRRGSAGPEKGKLVIEYRLLKDLLPFTKNARTHSKEQVDQIVASIKEFGFTNPILVDENGGIIAGHGRCAAAKKMAIKDVPVIVLAGLTEAQRRAYVLADNQLALNAGWDESLLRLELIDLKAEGFSLDVIGFPDVGVLIDPPPATPIAGVRRSGLGQPVIAYNIVFDDAGQQEAWFAFVRDLKAMYPNDETLGARISHFVQDRKAGGSV